MNRREQNRIERQEKVLTAAQKLIAKGGVDALTMRGLAQKAGLAVNTVYALFGNSREDVLEALIEEGISELDRMLHEEEIDDPLAAAPTLGTMVLDYILEREEVFRPVFLAEAHADHLGASGWGGAHALAQLREALGAAEAEGLLRDDVDLEVLIEHVFQSFRSWARLWAARRIEDREFRARVLYALHLALLAAATDETGPRLRESLRDVERSLTRGRRRRR